jgi:transcriptional regulator with XRE-family HTH domain
MSSTHPEPETPSGMTPGYDRIERAELDGDVLRVRFANGDQIDAPLTRLLGATGKSGHDAEPTVTPEAVLLGGEPPLELSWLAIRSATDEAFAEQLRHAADQEAKQIGERLRRLRKARNMTAKDVAQRAGITPMSLSRIETGKHDVVYRTLQRVLAAMDYTLLDLAALEPRPATVAEILKRLRDAGVATKVLERIGVDAEDQPQRVVDRVGRIFGWNPEDLAGVGPLAPSPAIAYAGRFKAAVNQNPARQTYVMWANYLAMLVDQACPRPAVAIPENPIAIRQDILAAQRSVRFEYLLDWCWEHHIAVLPLDDPGEFHGACWSFSGRVVVVLKQLTPWESRWTFDLAHEVGHVARHLDDATGAIVEEAEITPVGEPDDDEQEASDFAGELLLGQPDTLARVLVERTERRLQRLKAQVRALAEEQNVEVDALANYMAYRLAAEGESWWGTAAKLQDESGQAPVIARRRLQEHLELDSLDPDDRTILTAALGDLSR